MVDYPETYRVPTKYATGIGRIMARWAYVEWKLSVILQILSGTGPKIGRIALMEPRTYDYPKKYELILRVRKAIVATDLNKLASELKRADEERNLLAHGLWIRHPNTKELGVWHTRGAWEAKTSLAGTNRRIAPESAKRDPATMATLRRQVDALIKKLNQLEREIKRALRASRRKPRK